MGAPEQPTQLFPLRNEMNRFEITLEGNTYYVEWMGDKGAHLHHTRKNLYEAQTTFQHLNLYETFGFGKLLVLDGEPQSSEFDEDIYHEALVHPALVLSRNPESVLILGGGEGATLREVLRHLTVKKATMVDIDGEVVSVCKKELPGHSKGAFDDPRATVIIDDAIKFLKETTERFGCVISDLTEPDPETPSQGLLNEELFRLIKSKMKADGVFAMQASHATRGKNARHLQYISILKKVWKIVRPYRVFIPSFYSEWGFVLASDALDPLTLSAEEIDKKLAPIASALRYYDGRIHHAIFTPPKELRKID